MQTGLPDSMENPVGSSCPVVESIENATMLSVSSFNAYMYRPSGVDVMNRGVRPLVGRAPQNGLVDQEYGNAVAAAIGRIDEASRAIDLDFRRAAVARERVGQRGYHLERRQRPAFALIAICRDCRVEFIDDVRNTAARMKCNVPRPGGFA